MSDAPPPDDDSVTPELQGEIPSVSHEAEIDLKRTRRQRGDRAVSARIDRLPPHSPEAEMCILGCCLLEPKGCVPECIAYLQAGKEAFYDLRHQTVYDELVEMSDAGIAIDVITVMQRLKDKNLLDQVGGITFLSALPDAVPSAANLSVYLEFVQEKYLLRTMVHACTDAVSRIYEYEGDVEELLDTVERDILRVRQAGPMKDLASQKDLVNKAVQTIEDLHQSKGVITGISTGFIDLDKMTSGLHPGEMVVIAARPSMGKTSLAMNIVEHAAVEERLPVGVFSLEMTAEALMLRMLCSRARVNLRNVREGFLAERDFPKIIGASDKLRKAPIFTDDSNGLTILQLRAKARRMAQQFGIKLFVVDYLQLLRSESRRADNRQQEIADISGGLKALSKELQVPIIVLSQLNRDLEKEKGRRPRLADLRESGAIEQDADLVGLLYNPGKTDTEQDSESEALPVNLLIAKQRNGPTGDVHLTFLKMFTRFESAAKVSDVDEPVQEEFPT